jgi:hypothetical protein
MALHQLLSMMPHEVAQAQRSVVARWTDTPETPGWEPEPEYGAFVDDRGLVVTGVVPARAFLESDDPRTLELAPGTERTLGGAQVYFLDWGRQPLSWEEIFDLWEAWEGQGMIAGCGSVSVPWALATRWTAPGWVAFRDGFDGAPLAVTARRGDAPFPVETVQAETVRKEPLAAPVPAGSSFLARAERLRSGTAPRDEADEPALPQIPFTIGALRDPRHVWPTGLE